MTERTKDRLILLGVFLVFVAGVVLVALRQSQAPKLGGPLTSTYFTGRSGAKALYRLLGSLGWETARLRHPLSHLAQLDDVAVLFLIAPAHPVKRHEARILSRWVEMGGVLVVALDSTRRTSAVGSRSGHEPGEDADSSPAGMWRHANRALVEEFGLKFAEPAADVVPPSGRSVRPRNAKGSTAVGSTAQSRGSAVEARLVEILPEYPHMEDVAAIAVLSELRLDATQPARGRRAGETTTLAEDSRGVVVAVVSWGGGRLILLTDSFPVTNGGIGQADNALCVVRLMETFAVEGRRGATLAFDEYHQGFPSVTRGVAATYRFLQTPAGWATLQALLVLAGWLYLNGRRFGRPIPERPAPRRSEVEFVAALAEAYRRAGGARLALAALRRRFQHRIAEALGLGFTAETRTAGLEAALARRDPETARRVRQLLLHSADVIIRPGSSDQVLVDVARRFERLEKEIAGEHR